MRFFMTMNIFRNNCMSMTVIPLETIDRLLRGLLNIYASIY